jgi:hypothetical protein
MPGVVDPNLPAGRVTELSILATSADVHQPCAEYKRMEKIRKAPRTLMQGTASMRVAGKTYLPQKPAESDQTYQDRLKSSVLFNAFRRSVKQLTGKVFSTPVSLKDASETMEEWWEDIDLQGNSGDVFARDVFERAMCEGISFILVDYPNVSEGELPTTLGDQKTSGNRPYCVHIKPEQVIGWRSDIGGGARVLTQVRIMETTTIDDGQFSEKEVHQVRVLERGTWALWRRDENQKDVWVLYDQGTTSLAYIPLIPFYTGQTGFLAADPPLQDLADLNIKHWQSSSAQDHILDYVRFPILFARCLGIEAGGTVTIGPNNLIRSENENADLKHVEHTGASIDAGRQSLRDLEAQMAFLAMEPMLQQQSGDVTATKTAVDTSSAASILMAWAITFKEILEATIEFMSDYQGIEEPAEVQMNFDFVLSLSAADATVLLQAFQAGAISREVCVTEMMRRGMLSDDLDIEADAEKIDQEKAAGLELMAATMKTQGFGGQSPQSGDKNADGGGGKPPAQGKPPVDGEKA